MTKILLVLFRAVYIACVLIGCVTPVVHWIRNPEMTQMQVIMDIWWCYILIFIGLILVNFDKGLRDGV